MSKFEQYLRESKLTPKAAWEDGWHKGYRSKGYSSIPAEYKADKDLKKSWEDGYEEGRSDFKAEMIQDAGDE